MTPRSHGGCFSFTYFWVFVGLLTMTSACSLTSTRGRGTPPPTTHQLPIYPGAKQITIEPMPTAEPAADAKFILLETNDGPEDIRTFYKAALLKDGWDLSTVSQPATSDSIYFSWWDYVDHYGYTLDVGIIPRGTG